MIVLYKNCLNLKAYLDKIVCICPPWTTSAIIWCLSSSTWRSQPISVMFYLLLLTISVVAAEPWCYTDGVKSSYFWTSLAANWHCMLSFWWPQQPAVFIHLDRWPAPQKSWWVAAMGWLMLTNAQLSAMLNNPALPSHCMFKFSKHLPNNFSIEFQHVYADW